MEAVPLAFLASRAAFALATFLDQSSRTCAYACVRACGVRQFSVDAWSMTTWERGQENDGSVVT